MEAHCRKITCSFPRIPAAEIGLFDLLHVCQSRGDNEGLSLAGTVAQKFKIHQFKGGDLEKRAHFIQFIHRLNVKGGGEKENTLLLTVRGKLGKPFPGVSISPMRVCKSLSYPECRGVFLEYMEVGTVDLKLHRIRLSFPPPYQ